MTDEFAIRVKQIEASADRNLTLYKLKVLLLALLGYAYIFLVLAVLLVLVALLFWTILSGQGLNIIVINVEIALLVLVSIVVRSLWVKVPEPEGIEVSKEQAPALFETIDEIRRAVNGPVVHKILVTHEFNASVVSVPRMGMFGWAHKYLLVGLPLMHSLTAAEFRAVLAHEMGHLAGKHGRFSSWIYRIRVTWEELQWALEVRRHWGTRLFNGFFRWYVPYFSTYSFVLARRHEYEADLCSSEVATAQTTAEALIKCEVYSLFQAKFRGEFFELMKSQNSPPNYYSELAASLKAGVQSEDTDRWLQLALDVETVGSETHPSLKDRLSALGQSPHLPAPTTESAAEIYLSDELSGLIERMNVQWHEEHAAAWKEQHERFAALDDELRELNIRAASTELTADEAYRRACLVHGTAGSEAALPLYREALSLDKDHALANYEVGRILLSQDSDEGIAYLERATDLDDICIPASCDLLYSYFTKKGDTVTAQRYSRRATEHYRVYANAYAERSQVSFVDRFTSHDLTDQDVEQLRRELARNDRIREAYLVRKELKYKPEKPLYALGLVFDQRWLKGSASDSAFAQQLPTMLETQWQLYSFVLDAQNKRLETVLRKVPNSLIYER